MAWHEGLTEKQRRFVEAFSANGGNATKAAETAGYKKPHPQGAQTLRNVTVQEAIEALRKETTNTAIMTREERQAYWSRMVRGEEMIEVPNKNGDDPIKVPPDFKERLKASELLGRSQGDFIERHEVTGKDGGALRIIQVPRKEPAKVERRKLTDDDLED